MKSYLINQFNRFTGTQKVIMKNVAWLSIAEMASRLVRGLLSIVAARILGASGLGVFAYAIALGGIITFFEDAGIGTYVTRSFAKNDSDHRSVFASAFVLKLGLSFCALIAFIVIGPSVSTIPESISIIPFIAILMAADALRGFLYSIPRAEQRMHIESRTQIITNVTIFVLAIGALLINPTPLALSIGYVVGSLVGTLIMLWYSKNYLASISKYFSRSIFINIFKAAWPFTLLAIANVLIFNTDAIFLGYYSTTTEVGLYGAASRLVQLFYIVPVLIAVSTFPVLVKKNTEGEDIKKPLRKLLMIVSFFALPLTLIMILGSSIIIKILFGISFLAATPLLIILSLTYLPVFISSILNNLIIAKDLQNRFVWITLSGVAINIALDYLLVPNHGGVGAAIASVVGLSTITLLSLTQMRKLTN